MKHTYTMSLTDASFHTAYYRGISEGMAFFDVDKDKLTIQVEASKIHDHTTVKVTVTYDKPERVQQQTLEDIEEPDEEKFAPPF